jgi:hypothetical protein
VYRNTCENLNTQLLSEISHASCLLYFEVWVGVDFHWCVGGGGSDVL